MSAFQNMFIGTDDIVIHFETQDMLDAGMFAELIIEIVAFLRHRDRFGPEADVRIADILMGSLTARLKINKEALIVGAGLASAAAAVAQAVPGIAAMMEDPDTKAGQCAALIMVDQSVTRIEVKGSTCSVSVTKDNPAVEALERARALRALGITADTLESFDELVNVRMPRALTPPGIAVIQIEDLKRFDHSELLFPPHSDIPAINEREAKLYRAQGMVRKRLDGGLMFVDKSNHTTPVVKIDADWDVPNDQKVDIWFSVNPNKPLPGRALTVVNLDVL